MKTENRDQPVRELVGDAAAWRLASLLLERPRPNWRRELAAIQPEIADAELSSCVDDARNATEEHYHALFGPGGTVSPREVSYCGFEDPGKLMAELQSFYHAFSYLPQREEPIDHICVEAGFISYMLVKEAYARRQGSVEAAAVTREARTRFLREHTSRCATGISDQLSSDPLYVSKVASWLVQKSHVKARS